MPSTGIGPIDNLARLILAIFLLILFIMMGSRMLRMLHRHEYAQLVSTVLLFGIAFWFIYDPGSLVSIFRAIFSGASSKLGG